jgi:RND family efflux transporter MFP subunit
MPVRLPALLLAAAAALTGCSRSDERPALPALPSATVAVAPVESVSLVRRQPVAGTVRPARYATISARIPGTVTGSLPVLGATVAAGETLATLAADEVLARLAQARAVLAQVERELAREKSLLAGGAVATDSVRLLEDRQRAAAAAVDEAATLASYTKVAAPFAGVITRRFAEPGDFAATGASLLELEGTDRLRVEVAVPESLDQLPTGAELAIEADGGTFTGRLAEISPAADPATRSRLAKVDLPAGAPARSGQFVRVLWPAGRAEALLVPAAAIARFGQMEQVFVVESDRARLRLVRTAAREGDRIVVLAGLAAGENVVVAPAPTLRDGQPVATRP